MKEFLIDIAPIIPIIFVILIAARKQKPWSELTEKEKKNKIILVGIGVLLLLAGVVVAFLY